MLTRELGKADAAPVARWRDYYALTKPGVVQLLVFTAIVGMFLATPGMVPWDALVFGSLGIGLAAAAGAVVNHVLDQRLDAQMARTRNRPAASTNAWGATARRRSSPITTPTWATMPTTPIKR